jgi:hypothetical protein
MEMGWKGGRGGVHGAAAMEKAPAKAIPRPISLNTHQLSLKSLYAITALLIKQYGGSYQHNRCSEFRRYQSRCDYAAF